MKKTVLIVSLLFASTSAFASKARLSALQGANHLVDTQTVFNNPADIKFLSQFLTFELGAVGTDAEGGMLKTLKSGDRLLVYLGHKNSTAIGATGDLRASEGYIIQNNPVEVIYGTGERAFGASFSMVDNKKSGTKETTLIAKYGAYVGDFNYYAHLTALSTAEKKTGTDTDKLESAPRLTLGAAKDSADYRYFGALSYGQGKIKPGLAGSTDQNVTDTDLNFGFEDRSLKSDVADIYFGAKVVYSERKIDSKKINATALPVFAGVEYAANSWVTFRGSVSQNLIFGTSKDETATNTDADGIASNTMASAGLGFKYNNLTIDGALTAAADGKVNGNNFLTQTSATYNF